MYSQNSEERIIADYFGDFIGTLLDIGANDGITFSNSYALLNKGWRGWLIEPDREAYNKLWALYKDRQNHTITCYNIAVGNESKDVKFYKSGTHLNKGDTGLLSTVSKPDYEKWKSITEYKEYKVRMVSFLHLYKNWIPEKIDFITIDAEGMDLIILKQMDLNALGCKCICVEWNGENKAEFDNYITPFGLKLIHQNNENLIYAK